MKKVWGFLSIVIFFALLCVPLTAAAATLSGVWKGSANKVTEKGCSVVNVIFTVKCAKGKVAMGTLIVGNYTVTVLAKIDSRNQLDITSVSDSIYVHLYGEYVAGTPGKLVIQTSYIHEYPVDLDQEYDTFTLIKQ
jgi:hypothetical protein